MHKQDTWEVQIFVLSSGKMKIHDKVDKCKSKMQKQLLLQAGEQVGAVSSVEEASLVRRWEMFYIF